MQIWKKSYRISWHSVFFWVYAFSLLMFWFYKPQLQPKPKPSQLTPYQAEHLTKIETGKTTPSELVNFACSLAGTPYNYGSADPANGLDCSGFVTYVFKHFGIMVPRTSVDFTSVQHAVPIEDAKLGDIILFTGTDSTTHIVGHMGIVSSMPGQPIRFMHSTSGKGYGVVETDFSTPYYESRYVKVIRVFPQNDQKANVSQLLR
ncbi:MAG: C40 family peptidase [Mucilaginibacter sp.]